MKFLLFISAIALGATFSAKAQTTDTKNTPAVEVAPVNPVPVVTDTAVQVKKQCAGQGASQCSKGKGCCKMKTGEANNGAVPTSGATATPTPVVQPTGTGASNNQQKCGTGGTCCKKKAGQ
jgi:hypothetical protein